MAKKKLTKKELAALGPQDRDVVLLHFYDNTKLEHNFKISCRKDILTHIEEARAKGHTKLNYYLDGVTTRLEE